MTALIAFGYGFGIRRISALPDAQTTQARSQPHPTRTRTPPCDGPNVSKRDDIIPIGLAATSRFTLARRFPDVELPKLRGAREEADQGKEVGGVICVRQRPRELPVQCAYHGLDMPCLPYLPVLPSGSTAFRSSLLKPAPRYLTYFLPKIRCRTSRFGCFRAPYAAPGVRRDARPTSWPRSLGLSLVGP